MFGDQPLQDSRAVACCQHPDNIPIGVAHGGAEVKPIVALEFGIDLDRGDIGQTRLQWISEVPARGFVQPGIRGVGID